MTSAATPPAASSAAGPPAPPPATATPPSPGPAPASATPPAPAPPPASAPMASPMMTPEDFHRFCLADPDFFERPELLADDAERFAATHLPPPPGWRRTASDWWVRMRPARPALPAEGWLVHVSVGPADLEKAVEIVRGHCVEHGVPFDFVRSTTTAREVNGDRADRFGCGRLITVYAADDAVLTRTLTDLHALLQGMAGPGVLGALTHRDGPLHVRHGPYDGPARRGGAVFTPLRDRPLPPLLAEDLAARRAAPVGDFPYEVRRALRLGCGGGTYLADAGGGRTVVLKEARPGAGLDPGGDDAVARLAREEANLRHLEGLPCVPAAGPHRVVSGHHFLEVEHVEGTNLFAESLRLPLTGPAAHARREAPRYARRAHRVLTRLAQALDAVRARGLRLGELKPHNVVLRPNGDVVLVDLASATVLDDDRPPAHGDPGFTVPPGLTAAQAHACLLARVRVALLLPVDHGDPVKVPTVVSAIARHYPLPPGQEDQMLAALLPHGRPERPDTAAELFAAEPFDWPFVRDALVRGIHLSATPERADRLFPSTPTGPRALGGASFGYGAAGVLYALHQAGAEVPEEYVRWLVDAARAVANPPPGLYDGLHGVAYTLDVLGHRDEALTLIGRCPAAPEADLAGGRAGIALNLLHFAAATGEQRHADEALRLAGTLSAEAPAPARPDRYEPVGLLHGPTGAALLHCRLHELTGDEDHLDRAERHLAHDLARCVTAPDGGVHLRHSTTMLPYLHGGSWGLAAVLPYLLRHRPDAGRAALLAGVYRTCGSVYVRFPGLLRGRAGAIATLAAAQRETARAAADRAAHRRALEAQIRLLAWHARTWRGALAFPGLRMPRLSMDLATGSAGVLLALAAAFDGATALPHLQPRSAARPDIRKEVNP